MYIELTYHETQNKLLLNINNITSIIDKGMTSLVYLNTSEYIEVTEDYNVIKKDLEKLGFFNTL